MYFNSHENVKLNWKIHTHKLVYFTWTKKAKFIMWTVALEWALQKEDGLQQVRDPLRLSKTGSG